MSRYIYRCKGWNTFIERMRPGHASAKIQFLDEVVQNELECRHHGVYSRQRLVKERSKQPVFPAPSAHVRRTSNSPPFATVRTVFEAARIEDMHLLESWSRTPVTTKLLLPCKACFCSCIASCTVLPPDHTLSQLKAQANKVVLPFDEPDTPEASRHALRED